MGVGRLLDTISNFEIHASQSNHASMFRLVPSLAIQDIMRVISDPPMGARLFRVDHARYLVDDESCSRSDEPIC